MVASGTLPIMLAGLTLDGKIALVTGGAGGIGSAICRDLGAMGAHVVVADVDGEGAAGVAAALADASALPLDLLDADAIAAVATEQPVVDILVNNAGTSIVGPFVQSDPAQWDSLYRVNLLAPMLLTHAVLPGMLERQWGRIVFVSTDSARIGAGGEVAYSAFKSGLLGFSKSLAREAARGQVTSNAICPGPTDTPMMRGLMADNESMLNALLRAIPLRRLGEPDDIAGMVAYLCSERAGYVTGQTLSVSGGITMV
jgi:2-hydroxycyclohexanecarboxyl-CoA dehydrogenase